MKHYLIIKIPLPTFNLAVEGKKMLSFSVGVLIVAATIVGAMS